MITWVFPDTAFDMEVGATEYMNCRHVAHDEATVTIDRDYRGILGRTIRLRTQVRLEDVRAIHEHAVSAVPETAGLPIAATERSPA